jgi:hypothetical protein
MSVVFLLYVFGILFLCFFDVMSWGIARFSVYSAMSHTGG